MNTTIRTKVCLLEFVLGPSILVWNNVRRKVGTCSGGGGVRGRWFYATSQSDRQHGGHTARRHIGQEQQQTLAAVGHNGEELQPINSQSFGHKGDKPGGASEQRQSHTDVHVLPRFTLAFCTRVELGDLHEKNTKLFQPYICFHQSQSCQTELNPRLGMLITWLDVEIIQRWINFIQHNLHCKLDERARVCVCLCTIILLSVIIMFTVDSCTMRLILWWCVWHVLCLIGFCCCCCDFCSLLNNW